MVAFAFYAAFSATLSAQGQSRIVWVTPPTREITAGLRFGKTVVVKATDANDRPVSGLHVALSLKDRSNPPNDDTKLLVGTDTATTDSTGIAAFPFLELTGPANREYALTVVAAGARDATPVRLHTIAPKPQELRLMQGPTDHSSVTNGAAITPVPEVQVLQDERPIAGVSVIASLARGDAAISGATVAQTDANGIARFPELRLVSSCNAGVTCGKHLQTIRFSSQSISADLHVTIHAGSPAYLVLLDSAPVDAKVGVNIRAFRVKVLDRDSLPVPAAEVDAESADLNAQGGESLSNDDGVAVFSKLVLLGPPGSYGLVLAAASAKQATLQIHLAPGPVQALEMVTQPSRRLVHVDSALTTQPQVRAVDSAGNAVPNVQIQAQLCASSSASRQRLKGTSELQPDCPPAPGLLASLQGRTVATTEQDGVAQFQNLAITGKTGDYKIRFVARTPTGGEVNDTSDWVYYDPDYDLDRNQVAIAAIKTVAGVAPQNEFFELRFRFRASNHISVLPSVDIALSSRGTDSVNSPQKKLTEGAILFNYDFAPRRNPTTDAPERALFVGAQLKVFNTIPYYGLHTGAIELGGSAFAGSMLNMAFLWSFSTKTQFVAPDSVVPAARNLYADFFLRSSKLDFFKLLTIRGGVLLPLDGSGHLTTRIVIAIPVGTLYMF